VPERLGRRIGFEEGIAEDKKPTKTHIPFSKKKEEAPSISAVAGASFTIEGFEFRIVKVAFSETASGFVPKDMALGDHVVWVEFELLSGDQEAFEGQKINLTDGSGETRNAFILVSRGYQHMLKTVTMRSASQRYQPGKDCIVWAYAFPKSSDSLFLSFPTGEVVVLSPYMP
jgi:hypothetical protein